MHKRKLLKVLGIAMILLISFFIPFILEQMIFCESIWPFNIKIRFSKDVWFGFAASYLGAIGTFTMSFVALYQNKRYKELADESENRITSIQNEMLSLQRKNIEMIETVTKMYKASYFPIITNSYHTVNLKKGKIYKFDYENYVAFFDEPNDYGRKRPTIQEICKKYNIIIAELVNDGNTPIKNMSCLRHYYNYEVFINSCLTTDVESGEGFYVIFATRNAIDTLIGNYELEMRNIIGELFVMNISIISDLIDENYYVDIAQVYYKENDKSDKQFDGNGILNDK